MNKFLVSLGLISTLFFTACSSYSITKYFKKDEFYLKALQETKKSDILEKNEVKAIFTATYLNRVNKKFNDGFENFIVSIYEVNKSNQVDIELNDKKYLEIDKIAPNSELIKSIPLKNSWATYYLVKFSKDEDIDKLILKFKNQDNQEALLIF